MDVPEILASSKIVAVVGLSPKPDRPSNIVASYLKKSGYKIIPVNPGHKEILGEKCYASLLEIPVKVDIVDIFRRSEDVSPVVADAIKISARAVWMQEGIADEAAASLARSAGIFVVSDRCMLKEHERFARASARARMQK